MVSIEVRKNIIEDRKKGIGVNEIPITVYAQFANKGHILDITEVMEKDERFNPDDYLIPIFCTHLAERIYLEKTRLKALKKVPIYCIIREKAIAKVSKCFDAFAYNMR